jgi:hypothetical protein
MKCKFFVYDPESGFDTYETSQQAKESAEISIDLYRDNAGEGWDEEAEQVCWGEISEGSTMFRTGNKIEFEGKLVDSYDCKLQPINAKQCRIGES